MSNSIFICRNPIETHWHLGRTAMVRGFTLIGWRISPTRIDGGMPAAVAEILARAMIADSNVIFPSSDVEGDTSTEWKAAGDDLFCSLREASLIKRFLSSPPNAPSNITLLSTRKSETAIRLFDDAVHPWWMQGQVALLSESATPKIDRQILFFLESDWIQRTDTWQNTGIKSVLRPGTDGDTAGFLFPTEIFGCEFLTSLENESRAVGFNCDLLTEADFIRSIDG